MPVLETIGAVVGTVIGVGSVLAPGGAIFNTHLRYHNLQTDAERVAFLKDNQDWTVTFLRCYITPPQDDDHHGTVTPVVTPLTADDQGLAAANEAVAAARSHLATAQHDRDQVLVVLRKLQLSSPRAAPKARELWKKQIEDTQTSLKEKELEVGRREEHLRKTEHFLFKLQTDSLLNDNQPLTPHKIERDDSNDDGTETTGTTASNTPDAAFNSLVSEYPNSSPAPSTSAVATIRPGLTATTFQTVVYRRAEELRMSDSDSSSSKTLLSVSQQKHLKSELARNLDAQAKLGREILALNSNQPPASETAESKEVEEAATQASGGRHLQHRIHLHHSNSSSPSRDTAHPHRRDSLDSSDEYYSACSGSRDEVSRDGLTIYLPESRSQTDTRASLSLERATTFTGLPNSITSTSSDVSGLNHLATTEEQEDSSEHDDDAPNTILGTFQRAIINQNPIPLGIRVRGPYDDLPPPPMIEGYVIPGWAYLPDEPCSPHSSSSSSISVNA